MLAALRPNHRPAAEARFRFTCWPPSPCWPRPASNADVNDQLWTVPAKRAVSPTGPSASVAGSNFGGSWVHVAAPGSDLTVIRMRTAAEKKQAGSRPLMIGVRLGGLGRGGLCTDGAVHMAARLRASPAHGSLGLGGLPGK